MIRYVDCSCTSDYWDSVIASYKTRVVTAATFADMPITLEDAYHHCRIDTYSEDSPPDELISADDYWLENIGIPAAVAWASGYVGFAYATQTLEMMGESFPTYFELTVGPVQSIESVMYIDEDGDEQTMDAADYVLNSWEWPNRLQLAPGVDSWPLITSGYNAVKIRYVAGYTPPGDSPEGFVLDPRGKIGILLMLAHLYENREDVTDVNVFMIPNGARVFLDQVRKRSGFA